MIDIYKSIFDHEEQNHEKLNHCFKILYIAFKDFCSFSQIKQRPIHIKSYSLKKKN